MRPISERALLFGSFSGFAHMSFWYEQLVDEYECGVLVKLY
jgi:hypothetical protein